MARIGKDIVIEDTRVGGEDDREEAAG